MYEDYEVEYTEESGGRCDGSYWTGNANTG